MESRKLSLNQEIVNLPGDSETDGKEITMRRKDFLKSLECPVCFEQIFSPVLDCKNGHHLCCICAKILPECPQCKEPTSATKNRFAEEFMSKYVTRCKNHQNGCSNFELAENTEILKTHQDNCKFRKIHCWMPNCTTTVFPDFLADHWKVTHEHDIKYSETNEVLYQLVIPQELDTPYFSKAFHLQHNGNSFLAIFEMLKDAKSVQVYVYGYCPIMDTLRYYMSYIKLKVTQKDGCGGSTSDTYSWNGRISREFDQPFEIVKDEERAFHETLQELEDFSKIIDFTLSIKIVAKTPSMAEL